MGENGKKWEGVKAMFIGEYHYNLDDKGRLVIPSNFKDIIGAKIIIVRGLEQCLYLYSMNEWEKLITKLTELSFTKKTNREFTRLFLSGAYEGIIDIKGRINIETLLLKYANLTKECVIIGAGTRIEIWDKANWQNYFSSQNVKLEEISEELDL